MKKIVISKEMSVKELQRFLISSELSPKIKKDIRRWIANKHAKMEKDWEEGKTIFEQKGVYEFFNLFGQSNPVWELAKSQMFRKGSPMVKAVGKPPYHKIHFNVVDYTIQQCMRECLRVMHEEVEEPYFMYLNHLGKQPQEAEDESDNSD